MWMTNGFGMGAGGWLLMVLFWMALVALVVFAVVRLFPGRSGTTPAALERREEPREILKRRLASGEIDIATFEQLGSKLTPPSPAGRGS